MSRQENSSHLEDCQRALGLRFHDPELLRRALTHASTGEGVDGHNERLEFLGDAVLTLIITEYLFREHPSMNEGEMTEFKGAIVSGAELSFVGMRLGLEKWIRVGRGLSNERSIPRSIFANTYEAIVGALYLDSGFEACRRFALQSLREQIQRALHGGRNYKMLLQTFGQKNFNKVPSYTVIGRGGPAFARSFQVAASLQGVTYPPAWGKTIKEAEQWAAREALLAMEMEKEQREREAQEDGEKRDRADR